MKREPGECDEVGAIRAVRAVLAGDVDAFAVLVGRYERRVASIVARHVPRDQVAETAHEVFVRAFQSLSGYKERSPFEHWLSSIAVRTCCDYWRGRGRRRETLESDLPGGSEDDRSFIDNVADEAGGGDPVAAEVERREAARLLHLALGRLSAEDRMVVSLVHLEGASVAEAAALLGMSAANVKIRAFRARGKLRAFLAGLMADGSAGAER
jgi:RNA polymerase sigma-70 factor (ECF subfamily)